MFFRVVLGTIIGLVGAVVLLFLTILLASTPLFLVGAVGVAILGWWTVNKLKSKPKYKKS